MNYTPYEMKILLEVHCGMMITATQSLPLFTDTMRDFIARGLVKKSEIGYAAGENLAPLMAHVLGAMRPMPIGQRGKLTTRQGEILEYVKTHIASKRLPPTRAEIADRFGFNSTNAAEEHLRALQKKGYLKIGVGTARGLQVIA